MPRVSELALACFRAGYGHQIQGLMQTFQFHPAESGGPAQVVMSGNEALAYGLIAAGVRFGAGYPDHAVERHHGIAAARIAQIRRHVRPDRG